MNPHATLAAAAALGLLTGCCSQARDTSRVPIPQLPSPELRASYAPADDGTTFGASIDLRYRSSTSQGDCLGLPAGSSADVAGMPMGQVGASDAAACACHTPSFGTSDAAVPAAPGGAFRVTDGTSEMKADVPELFVPQTVALRAPATALARGSRVFLDFAPASAEVREVVVSFTPMGQGLPVFTLSSAWGEVVNDGSGWSFVVPNIPLGAGELSARTQAHLAATCTGAATCEVTSDATRRIATEIVP